MVDMNTKGDLFSTADTPKQSSAAHQEIAMPKHEHPLSPASEELDDLFWTKILQVQQDELVSAEEQKIVDEMKSWLVQFDTQMKGAIVLMCKPSADETKPFQEKYEAREILETLRDEIKASWLEKTSVMKAVKALIYNRLG